MVKTHLLTIAPTILGHPSRPHSQKMLSGAIVSLPLTEVEVWIFAETLGFRQSSKKTTFTR